MRTYRLILAAVVGLSCTMAASADPKIAERLLAKFGKDALVPVITERCHGNITIESEGRFRQVYGRPRKDLVTAESIAEDMGRCHISESDFAITIRREERTASGQDMVRATGWTNRLLTKWQRRGLSSRETTLRADRGQKKAEFLKRLLLARASGEFDDTEMGVLEAAAIGVHRDLCDLAEDILETRDLERLACNDDRLWVLTDKYLESNGENIERIELAASLLIDIQACDDGGSDQDRAACLETLRAEHGLTDVRDLVRGTDVSGDGEAGQLRREIIAGLTSIWEREN